MSGFKKAINNNAKELVTVALIILVFIASAIAKPELFSAERIPEVISSVLLWMPINLTVACGLMMAIIVKGTDLSVGSMVALTAMITGVLFRDAGLPLWGGVVLSCITGLILGAFNGFFISYMNIPALIVTLGTYNAYRGLTYIISDGTQVTGYELPEGMSNIVTQGIQLGKLLVPWIVLIAVAIAIIFFFVLRYTHFGREVYAVGSNYEAAHLRGINCKKTVFFIFVIIGFLCGIAGMMSAARFGYINPSNTGMGLEFVVISATIIGGVSASGGSGTVHGVFLGCMLLGVVNTMIAMLGIPGTVQKFCYGIIIVIALLVDRAIQVSQQKKRIADFARREENK